MDEAGGSTEVVERPSPPPDTALALRQATASSVKRLQANGMKPTIIEDSESDEDAITKAREDVDDNAQNEEVMKSMQEPLGVQENKEDEEEEDEEEDRKAGLS